MKKIRENQTELVYLCPFCENRGLEKDTKGHLYFYKKDNLFLCFRCGYRETVSKDNILNPNSQNTSLSDLKLKLENYLNPNRNQIVFDLDKVSWKMDKEKTPIAYNYIINRGFTDKEIEKYRLRVGIPYLNENLELVRKWQGRVIFPYFDNEKCIYFIGRSYTNREPKYLNTKTSKGLITYNLSNKRQECVIICEGFISAIAAERITGINSTAVLGKSISNLQAAKIRNITDKIYLSFDGDATKKDLEKPIKILKNFGFSIYIIKLPIEHDPDSLKEKYFDFFNKAEKITIF